MATFLFLLLFIFVLWPLGRVAWAAWRQYRVFKQHMRRAQEFQDSFRRAQESSHHTSRNNGPTPRKKKIARDVGEYVAFEEVRVYASESTTTERPEPAAPSSQIEDADWEDIRDR